MSKLPKFEPRDDSNGTLKLDEYGIVLLTYSTSRAVTGGGVLVLNLSVDGEVFSSGRESIADGETPADVANKLIPEVFTPEAVSECLGRKLREATHLNHQIDHLDPLVKYFR